MPDLDALLDTEWRACANGCTDKGSDTPRIAKHGNFCGKEWGRARAALKIVPELMEHMVSLKTTSAGDALSEKVKGTKTPPTPGNEQAMNDIHETYRRLVYWSAVWSKRMGVTAPGPAIGAWKDGRGRIVGLPANVSPSGAKFVARIMTAWLELHLESIFHLDVDDVNFWLDDLKDVFRLNAKWPREQRPFFSNLPCPDDKGRIAVYPPRWEGDDIVYKCESCGRLFSEKDHAFYMHLFKEIEGESNPVKRRLMRKYGA